MAMKSTKPETITSDSTESTILETAPEPITLEQLLSQRYDVEQLADVLSDNFVERLDNAVISKIKAKLLSRPTPIAFPVVAGNFLAGVGYEN